MAQLNVDGSDLMLFVGGAAIAFATNHKLTVNVETVETTSKDSGGKWKSAVAKKISWSVSSDNLYLETAFDDLFTKMVARTPIEVNFSVATNASGSDDGVPEGGWTAGTGYTGQAIITSLEANAPNGDNATFSVLMEGVGALKSGAAA